MLAGRSSRRSEKKKGLAQEACDGHEFHSGKRHEFLRELFDSANNQQSQLYFRGTPPRPKTRNPILPDDDSSEDEFGFKAAFAAREEAKAKEAMKREKRGEGEGPLTARRLQTHDKILSARSSQRSGSQRGSRIGSSVISSSTRAGSSVGPASMLSGGSSRSGSRRVGSTTSSALRGSTTSRQRSFPALPSINSGTSSQYLGTLALRRREIEKELRTVDRQLAREQKEADRLQEHAVEEQLAAHRGDEDDRRLA